MFICEDYGFYGAEVLSVNCAVLLRCHIKNFFKASCKMAGVVEAKLECYLQYTFVCTRQKLTCFRYPQSFYILMKRITCVSSKKVTYVIWVIMKAYCDLSISQVFCIVFLNVCKYFVYAPFVFTVSTARTVS